MDDSTALIIVSLVYLFFGYFYGSIPFGFILGKLFGIDDIRKVGSGNIGATNALRTGKKTYAFLTLLLDGAKGGFLIYLIFYLNMTELIFVETMNTGFPSTGYGGSPLDYIRALIFGLGAIIGHCFPVWLKFKGGKGVATTLGVLLAAVPWAGVVACVTWGIVAGFFRISSLSALVAVGIVPIATFLIYGAAPAVVTILIALLVFWRHKENIQRLLKGEEPKIGQKKEEQK